MNTTIKKKKKEKNRNLGASIICFSTIGKDIYFLLGKERKYKGVSKSSGASKWCDFGGASIEEESPEQTAVREFTEETAAIIKFYKDEIIPRKDNSIICKMLQDGKYYKKLTFKLRQGFYTTFVVQIPFQKNANIIFQKTLYSLKRGHKFVNHPAFITDSVSSYIEKSRLAYFSIPQLTLATEQNGKIHPILNTTQYLRNYFISRLIKILDCFEKYAINWRSDPRDLRRGVNSFINFNKRLK